MDILRITGTGESDPRTQRTRTLLTTVALVAVMAAPLPLWFVQVPWWVLLVPPVVILAILFVAQALLTAAARGRELVLLEVGEQQVVLTGRSIPWDQVRAATVVLHGGERDGQVTGLVVVATPTGEQHARLPAGPGAQVREVHRALRRALRPHGVKVGWQAGAPQRS